MRTEIRDSAAASGSPLANAEHLFLLVALAPQGPAIDGRSLSADLPSMLIPLVDLREILLDRSVSNDTRDRIWRELVHRARTDSAEWMIGAVGLALPSLLGIARQLTRDYTAGDPEDIDTEVLAAFMDAVRTVDLDRPNIRPRLCDAAKTAGLRACRIAESHSGRRAPVNESTPPPQPQGHPDFVLADAVAKGIVSELDAELIGRTRLEDRTLSEVAAELGLTTEAATKRRQRAEPVLCAAVQAGKVAADMSLSITSAAPLRVEDPDAPARSRTTSDTQSDSNHPKGGRGALPGSARIHPPTLRYGPLYPAGRTHDKPRTAGKRIALVLLVVLLVLLLVATAASAETVAAAPSSLSQVINNLRNWLIGFLVALATLMATIGGLRYLLAGGDPSEVAKAKNTLKFAAFGYGIAALAPLLVSALKSIVGV